MPTSPPFDEVRSGRVIARSPRSLLAMHSASAAMAAALLISRDARAMDPDLTSDTAAQFYDVRSPTGETTLNRRRLTTMLGLAAYDLLDTPPGDPKAPELTLTLRLRYDADYGAPSAASDPTQINSFVPGFNPALVDLMYGYVEGRRFLGGWFGFKVGRQYVTDALGWWSFDGGEASVTTPYYVKAEVYGGLEQRGGLPLSTSRFESDGVWRGDRANPNFLPTMYPAFQVPDIAPAIGVALETTGVTWLHGRVTYRQVYNTSNSNTSEFASGLYPPSTYKSFRISSDRLGYEMDSNLPSVGGVKGGIVYDFYRSQVTSGYASLDAYAGKRVTLSVDYDYYQPSFDADSIWNFFAGEPRSNLGLRGNFNVTDHLSLSADGHVRIFAVASSDPNASSYVTFTSAADHAYGTGYFPPSSHSFDEGGDLSARWRTGATRVAVHASGDFGEEGDRAGGDVSAEHVFETRYVVGGRAGFWQWKDALRADQATSSFQYVANLGYRFLPRCQGAVEWEHDINGLVGQRFRVMLLLSLGVGK